MPAALAGQAELDVLEGQDPIPELGGLLEIERPGRLLHVHLERGQDLRELLGPVLGPLLRGQRHGQVVGLDHRHLEVADVPLHGLRA